MPTTITRRYHFEAAHWLPHVSWEHKCHRIHGHNYELEVTVGGSVGENGFIIDFWDLDKVVQPLIDCVDHRCLNDITGLNNPTAEIISAWFLERLLDHGVINCRVYETKDCWADASHV